MQCKMASYKWIESERSVEESSITNSSHVLATAIPTNQFRVRVCLRRVYDENDPRSLCYVSVVPNHRVRWLKKRLCTLLGLKESFLLRSRGYLLPDRERLTILRPDDPVEVFPVTSNTNENGQNSQNYSASLSTQTKPTLDIIDGNKSEIGGVVELLASSHHTKVLPVEETMAIQNGETETDLNACKENALSLLETYSQNQHEKEDSVWVMEDYSDHSPKKRKRVRRRKHRNLYHEGTETVLEEAKSQPTSSIPTTPVESRAPRLVSALP